MASPLVMPVDFFDYGVRLNQVAVAIVIERIILLQRRYLFMPFAEIQSDRMALAIIEDGAQIAIQDADMVPVDRFNLANLGGVDVELCDALRLGSKLLRYRGNPVVEARADRDDHIAVFHRIVGIRRAMHAQHLQREFGCRIVGSDAHQCGGNRYTVGV